MVRALALCSSSTAQEGVDEAFAGGCGALQAALTGFFVAAGADPGVAFSPLSILIGGLGAGVFAYDGRSRQPGREAKRPRGFLTEQQVPATAFAAVPGSIAAVATACAFQPGTSLRSCVRPGVARAKSHGAKGRAHLLESAASLGATVLQENAIKRAFMTQFGVVEQGAVTQTDLYAPKRLQFQAEKGEGGLEPSWKASSSDVPLGEGHAIVAVDSRGLFVALSYSSLPEGLVLEPFEVTVPSLAVPVMRGVSRVSPGAALPMSTGKLHMLLSQAGQVVEVSAVPRSGAEPLRLIRDSVSKEVSRAILEI